VAAANVILGLDRSHTSLATLVLHLVNREDEVNLKEGCGLLIHIDQSNKTVRLVHVSVKEYLLGHNIITKRDTTRECAIGCITYLAFEDFPLAELHPEDHSDRPILLQTPIPTPTTNTKNDHCLFNT